MAKVTLPNGLVIEGTPDQVNQTLNKLGVTLPKGQYYNSDSQGTLLISTMNTGHVRNALLKVYREWSAELSGKKGLALITALRNGNTSDEFVGLLTEYVKRVARGEE